MRTRTFVVIGLLAALLVAGVGSYWASSHPDGLEFVAEKVGFADAAEDSATAGSPLSDYQVKGVENEALAGGLAGIIGAGVVLLLAGGLAYAVRRRGTHDPAPDTSSQEPLGNEPGEATDDHAVSTQGRERG
jgi:hypothetical protein